jgi:hypothetical protein
MAPRRKPDIEPLFARDVDIPAILSIGRDAWERIKASGEIPIIQMSDRTVGCRMEDLRRFVRRLPERKHKTQTEEC